MGDSGNRLWPIDKVEAAVKMFNDGGKSWREGIRQSLEAKLFGGKIE